MKPKLSLTEGPIPRALLSFSLPILFGFSMASVASLVLATLYYRFGGWRKVRMGVAEVGAVPVARA